MPMYLLTHHFPKGFQTSPETAAAATAWFERLGSNLVGRGDPRVESRRLGNCATDPEIRAYALLSTASLEAALDLAGGWPLLARGGGVEVRALSALPLVAQAPA
jgi:hypothetical protein